MDFHAEVRGQFGPIARSHDMAGPAEDDVVLPTSEWTAGPLGYRWSHDPSDGSTTVTVSLAVAGGQLWTSLTDLVVAHRLGAAQDVRTSGPMDRQVESQAGWLRRLHPALTGPRARAFLESGGARFAPAG